MGYLGTHVDRPVLDREATVHASDFEYKPNENIRVNVLCLIQKSTVKMDMGLELDF